VPSKSNVEQQKDKGKDLYTLHWNSCFSGRYAFWSDHSTLGGEQRTNHTKPAAHPNHQRAQGYHRCQGCPYCRAWAVEQQTLFLSIFSTNCR